MSKVLVDRELLERTATHLEWDGSEPMTTIQFAQKCDGLADELRRAVARPAESEGVEVVGVVCISHFKNNPAMENVEFHLAADLPQGQHGVILHSSHRADLSAVTAERDRLVGELATVKKVAYGNLDLLEENYQLRAEVEALRAFVTDCAETAGSMVNGNRLSHRAKELIPALAAKEA